MAGFEQMSTMSYTDAHAELLKTPDGSPDDITPMPGGSSVATTTPANLGDRPNVPTTQAVRVVVWRDANGVHVAPAGTVVSAITVDAVLVALEPSADLTAWLTQKGR